MDEPNCYVASEELVQMAGIRSMGIQVVKVYICHLLRAVGQLGADVARQAGRVVMVDAEDD